MSRKLRSRRAAAAKRDRRQNVAEPSVVLPALFVYTPSKPAAAMPHIQARGISEKTTPESPTSRPTSGYRVTHVVRLLCVC